jgi:energy-coupling factor transport system substrate-specific component
MRTNIPTIILGAACVALSVALGTVIYLLKLPIYLDQPGIMLAAMLAPGTRGRVCLTTVTVAVLTFVTMGLLVSPFSFWFTGTGIASALYGVFVVRDRVADLIDGTAPTARFLGKLLLFGIGWGIVAAVVSAPVTIYLFGGVTGAGSTLIVAFLAKTGYQIVNAVLLTGFSVEPFDKTLSLLVALVVARFTPSNFRKLLQ